MKQIAPLFIILLLLNGLSMKDVDAQEKQRWKPVVVATKAAIRSDGTLMVDDKPVFPVGIRTEDKGSLKKIADAGFNMVLGSDSWEAEYYAEASKNNLLIIGGHYLWATFATFRGDHAIDLKPSEEAGLKNVLLSAYDWSKRLPLETLAAFDHLPGVIGWNTTEEPEARLVEVLEYAYEIYKSQSPSHVIVNLADRPQWFHLWKNTADVLLIDNYPFRGGAFEQRSLIENYDYIKTGIKGMDGGAVWHMTQLIPPSHWSLKPDIITLKDLRLQHYAGLIGGAKGVIMYEWDMLLNERNSDGWKKVSEKVFNSRYDVVKKTVEELNILGPIICNGRVSNDLKLGWLNPGAQGPGPQMVREIDYYGKKYVLVANPLDVPVKAKIWGWNAGNRRGYKATVFQGKNDLSVLPYKDPGIYVDGPWIAELEVAPRGSGVFLLERLPFAKPDPKDKTLKRISRDKESGTSDNK